MRKYEGPFPIVERVGKVAYRVELPQYFKTLHPVFHASNLKPFHADEEDPSRGKSLRPRANVVDPYDREVEAIVADRQVQDPSNSAAEAEYLVKWKGVPDSEASWERASSLSKFQGKILEYLAGSLTGVSTS